MYLLLGLIISLLLSGPSLAATVARAPTSVTASSGTFNPSSDQHLAVDDYPDTTPADTLTMGTTTSTISFGFTAFSIPTGSTSISVQVKYYDDEASNGNNSIAGRLTVGGTVYNASTHNPSTTQTSREDSWATNPKSSAAWTVDDVNGVGTNALQAFGIHSADSNPTFFITSIQVQVTYTPPAASYSYTMDSGSLSGGTATYSSEHTIAVDMSGGTIAGGGGLFAFEKTLAVVGDGGAVHGGSADWSAMAQFSMEMGGGSVFGGSGDFESGQAEQSYSHNPNGGVVYGGVLDFEAVSTYSALMDSGALFGGSADLAYVYGVSFAPDGGGVFAGAATMESESAGPQTFAMSMSGGGFLGGTATYEKYPDNTPSTSSPTISGVTFGGGTKR